eukprot:TRINITY_DN9594_c2_g1_i1.p1 TRINITY_DN9594_c2_g1~~TRINITY_DN9594_c2_g1_i1.p1  ORF type:complete len:102 (+),score=14.58 TRINITY_DN9594_c2_g1_i1:90-395(+)
MSVTPTDCIGGVALHYKSFREGSTENSNRLSDSPNTGFIQLFTLFKPENIVKDFAPVSKSTPPILAGPGVHLATLLFWVGLQLGNPPLCPGRGYFSKVDLC